MTHRVVNYKSEPPECPLAWGKYQLIGSKKMEFGKKRIKVTSQQGQCSHNASGILSPALTRLNEVILDFSIIFLKTLLPLTRNAAEEKRNNMFFSGSQPCKA